MPRGVPSRLWMVVIVNDDGAQVSMAVDPLTARDIAKVTFTVADGRVAHASTNLDLVGSTWQGTSGPAPAGTHRTFRALAFDASGVLLFEGMATGVTTVNTEVVMVILRQANAPLANRECAAGEHCDVCQP